MFYNLFLFFCLRGFFEITYVITYRLKLFERLFKKLRCFNDQIKFLKVVFNYILFFIYRLIHKFFLNKNFLTSPVNYNWQIQVLIYMNPVSEWLVMDATKLQNLIKMWIHWDRINNDLFKIFNCLKQTRFSSQILLQFQQP